METKKLTIPELLELVHINHVFDKDVSTEEIIKSYRSDVYSWYLVYEMGWGNSPRVHLVSAIDIDDALVVVMEYLEENYPEFDISNLVGVNLVELNF